MHRFDMHTSRFPPHPITHNPIKGNLYFFAFRGNIFQYNLPFSYSLLLLVCGDSAEPTEWEMLTSWFLTLFTTGGGSPLVFQQTHLKRFSKILLHLRERPWGHWGDDRVSAWVRISGIPMVQLGLLYMSHQQQGFVKLMTHPICNKQQKI